MSKPSRRPRGRSSAALDASLSGAGVDVAAPPLGRLGRHLQRAELGPSPEFRANLRSQLVTAAYVAAPAAPARSRAASARRPLTVTFPRFQRQLAARLAAGLAAGGVLVAGVGTASARALPGDALYGVKRDAESVQLDLAGSDSAKGLLHLQFAATRLKEVHSLLTRAGISTTTPASASKKLPASLASTIQSTLTSMDNETQTGASELTTVFLQQRKLVSLTKLASFANSQESALTSVLPALPVPAALTSLGVLRNVQSQTSVLLSTVPPAPAGPAATPSATPTPSVTPSGSPSPTSSPTPTTSESTSPSATPETSESVEPSVSPSTEPTPTVSPTVASPTPSASASPSDTAGSPTPSVTPSAGDSPSPVTSSPRITTGSPSPASSP